MKPLTKKDVEERFENIDRRFDALEKRCDELTDFLDENKKDSQEVVMLTGVYYRLSKRVEIKAA
ncbi:MAG: hypothetical protein COU06_02655 [Candidatus Harrisonbacteria bacterium CG10_big_fil_rev_8_21_14_0_10_38_8]|uniref:Uncharacterized protein n=1 Tax=Candidatus Harrisonbacteria bacterium CG10_big_fil_rev_8_21_14_0_10_38_8 TaxID=1974582 RepID=A0A2M6WJH9_9BACT|nr:MAG: hypothetical protein COU06_02655 [Candidatus Harrisonbacteria bacterium CG10_big_fil_rev_8_21_14_0_10_38_8]